LTKRAARAALPPALLGASHARRRPRRRPFFPSASRRRFSLAPTRWYRRRGGAGCGARGRRRAAEGERPHARSACFVI